MPKHTHSTLWRKLERVMEKLDKRQKFCQLSQMIIEDQEKPWRSFNNEPYLLPHSKRDPSGEREQHRYYCRVQPALPIGDLNERYGEFSDVDYICTIFYSDTFYPSARSSKLRLKRYLKESEALRHEVANITCTSIDSLLVQHFDNGISLEVSSVSENWVPLVLKLHVRTTETTWQRCLFVVFGEDKLRYRVADSPQVREAIIDAWAVRQVVPISHHLVGRSRQKQSYKEEQMDKSRDALKAEDPSQNDVSHDIRNPILRGRKRRHTRWALQDTSAVKSLGAERNDSSLLHAPRTLSSDVDTTHIPKAPLRAQEASENGGRVDGLPRNSTELEANTNTVRSSSGQSMAMKKDDYAFDRHRWYYKTNAPKNLSINIDIRIHPSSPCYYDFEHRGRTEKQEAESTKQNKNAESTSMPILSISHDKPEPMVSKLEKKIRSYALVSYRAPRGTSSEGVGLNPKFEEELIIAVVVDRDECIGNLACETLGQWINVTPELNLHRSYLGGSSDHHSEERLPESGYQEAFKADTPYWHKFSQLIAAHPHTRRLPFSHGYGNKHSNPPLIRRSGRWGILNVDEVTSNLPQPRSRAVWSFSFSTTGAPACQCRRKRVAHTVDVCRSIIQDEHLVPPSQETSTALPDDLFSSTLTAAHRPWEYFRSSKFFKLPPDPTAKTTQPKKPKKKSSIENLAYGSPEPPPNDEAVYLAYGLYVTLGVGLPKSEYEGLKWVRKAAEHGSKTASSVLPQLVLASQKEPHLNSLLTASVSQLDTAAKASANISTKSSSASNHLWRDTSAWSLDVNQNYPDELAVYPDSLGMLQLAKHKTLDQKLDKPRLWLSKNGFLVPSKSSSQLVNFFQTRTNNSQDLEFEDDLYLLSRTPYDDNDYKYVLGSLLHFAGLWNLPESSKVLINRGYNVNAECSHQILTTPLLCAAAARAPAVIDLLVNAGANPDPPTKYRRFWAQIPSVLHHLVEWEDELEAIRIAKRVVGAHGDINLKCNPSKLERVGTATTDHVSTTPLQYAVMHQKPALVETFIDLGARFATKPVWKKGDDRVSLLETPCTDLQILRTYFNQLQKNNCVISSDFSETPLGLLLDEDDSPQRRVRMGFSKPTSIIMALDLLLDLQPGSEVEAFSAIVRHDHVTLAEHILRTKKWSTETRWKGMTAIHLAVLHGRPDMCSLLLKHCADPIQVTEQRRLTCLHLVALMPRHPDIDGAILQMLPIDVINVNACETVDGLTALHMAVRNQKSHLIDPLLSLGANILLPLYDRIETLAEGRYGCLKDVASRPKTMVKDIHILAEVIWQFHQDSAYSLDFVELLLEKCLAVSSDDRILYVDTGKTITILHVVATMFRRSFERLFPILQSHFGAKNINVEDINADTPLHFAAAARRASSVRALIESGADTGARNHVHLRPHELMAWSVLYLSGRHIKFSQASTEPWYTDDYYPSWDREQKYKNEKRIVHIPSELSEALDIFEECGHTLDQRLERLIMGWDTADMPMGHGDGWWKSDDKIRMQLVPLEWTDLKVNLPLDLRSNDPEALKADSDVDPVSESRGDFHDMTFSTSKFDKPYTSDFAEYVTYLPGDTEGRMYLEKWEQIYPGDGEADACDNMRSEKSKEEDLEARRANKRPLMGGIRVMVGR